MRGRSLVTVRLDLPDRFAAALFRWVLRLARRHPESLLGIRIETRDAILDSRIAKTPQK
jgi:hypothetical protein